MTTENLRALTLGVSLTVNDIAASIAWYRDVIGFTVERNYEREGKLMAVALQSGDIRLLLTHDDGAKGRDRLKGDGFSLQITTAQDIDAIANGIKSRGGKLESEPETTRWGMRVFRLRDPDGFKLAISSPNR
jgi:uncharacterized glyoxalase superfamily protein PhnB